MRQPTSPLIGSVSHGAETYGPRLIQLGIALLRGHIVPPYNYVRHHVVTRESLLEAEEAAQK
jgi:ribose transport system substrate-binding protein